MTTLQRTTRRRQWNVLIPRIINRTLIYILLLVFAVIFIFPFYDMFIGSFMQDSDLFSRQPNLWPKDGFDFTTYQQLFTELGYGRPLINTFYVALVQTLGVLFFSALDFFSSAGSNRCWYSIFLSS